MASADRKRIGKALARLLRRGGSDTRPLAQPGCEFGLIVDERLREVTDDIETVMSLLRAVLLAIIAGLIGLVVNVVVRGL